MTESQLQEILLSAVKFHQAENLEQAGQLYQQVLAEDPANADALHRLGYLRFQQGEPKIALDLIQQAIDLRPDSPEFHGNLGVALGAMGRWKEAIAAYQKAIALKPDFAQAYFSLGCAWQALGDWPKAIDAYQKALGIFPNYAEAGLNLGGILLREGKFQETVTVLQRACALRPDIAPAQNDLGIALRETGRPAEAMIAFQQAARLRPDNSDAIFNAAVTLHGQWHLQPAIAAYRRALQLSPDKTEYLTHLAIALFESGQHDEAIPYLRKSIAQRPDDAEIHWVLGSMLLSTGNFQEGLQESEWRLKVKSRRLNREFPQPQWEGSNIEGKTILLHAEGGHGDAIHYVRYLPMLAGRGARIILECQPALVPLFEQFSGVDRLMARGEPLPAFDVHIPLIGLPRIFGTTLQTIPANVPYIKAPPDRIEKFRGKLPGDGKLKVGLVWQGSPVSSDIRTRTLDVLAPLGKVENVHFVNLQAGPAGLEKPPENLKPINFNDDLKDFADIAGLLSHLDLLISVDTSVAHLAGAMARPVWTLIPCRSDSRWLLNREDSPWYPTMKLFRQKQLGQWTDLIERMATELSALACTARKA